MFPTRSAALEFSLPMRSNDLHYRLCRADLAIQPFRYQGISFIPGQVDAEVESKLVKNR
jgi:hypothetical protein